MSGKRFFSAASESQAVGDAAAELGIPPSELAYTVRQGALRPGRVVIVVDPAAPRRAAAPPAAAEPRRERLARAEPAPAEERPRSAAPQERGEGPARLPLQRTVDDAGGDLSGEPLPATGVDGARRAAAALAALAGLDVAAEVREAGGVLRVDLAGPGQEALVARNGETLRAADYLLRRMVRELPDEGLVLDSAGFRAQREEALRRQALAAAEEVRRSGTPVLLEGLDSSERRIVHMAVLAEPGVRSQSEGEGERRRLAILPDQGA